MNIRMVAVAPFHALRYNPAVVGDLSAVVAPPYDVISPAEQEQLYQQSPYNVVRLILGKQYPTDTPDENRYARARRDFDAWRANGALHSDPHPAFYVIEHAFEDAGSRRSRLGFIGLLQLEGSSRSMVYRHEATLAAPKADRQQLLEAIPASLEPIFCVYPDEQGAIQALLEGVTRQSAPVACAAMQRDRVRMWALTDASLIERIARHLGPLAVLIADGHHRFEVAYANRAQFPALMSYCVSMADPSLVVRPIHRLVPGQAARHVEALRGLCLFEEAPDLAAVQRWQSSADSMPRPAARFGFHDGKRFYTVTVRPDALAQWLISPTVPLPLAVLDVSILHELILPRANAQGGGVRYVADAAQALDEVRRAGQGSVWFLNGIPLRQVYALAAQGLILPPKSTYFYPKVPSGLAINLLR